MKLTSLALSVSSALVLIACSKEAPPPASPPVTAAPPPLVVKLGHAAPLTGPQAHLGKDNENGAWLAIADANARKPRIGGRDVLFELLSEDDQGIPSRAR